jgi:hypothetical protein
MRRRARLINMVLGTWLLASAFLWPHAAGQFRNSWSAGSLCIVVAALARSVPPLRYANTVLGLWLVIATVAGARISDLTVWNNVLVGAAIAAVSLFSVGAGSVGPRQAPSPP